MAPASEPVATGVVPGEGAVRAVIWAYFWMLIFEGAVRKWILPQLSTPLLIVRDPVVMLIYVMALGQGKFPRNPLVLATLVLAVVSFLTSFVGIGTPQVTLYGLRTDFLHLPLIFVIPRYFNRADVKKIGLAVIALSVPMALLVLKQFRSSPEAWINVGAGGTVGGQLYAALGRIRPAGLFSFVTGMVAYLGLLAAFVLYDLLEARSYKRVFVLAAIPALLLSLAISGSRAAIASVSIIFCGALYVCFRKGSVLRRAVGPLVLIYVTYVSLSYLPVFKEGMAVNQARFEAGGGLHEGIVDRFLIQFTNAYQAAFVAPVFGFGLGLGTNAGAGLAQGARQFLLAEDEWPRVILESGVIIGGCYILLRVAILVEVTRAALRAERSGTVLPVLLLSACGLDLLVGQFGQPTALGFAVFVSGLCLAAATPDETTTEPPEPPVQEQPRKLRRRSAYAEMLHAETRNKPGAEGRDA